MNFSVATEISASPDLVWRVISDIERWAEWTPTVTSIRRLDSGPLAVGSRARIRQPRLPPAEWRVTELEEGRGFTWVTGGPGAKVSARHWVDPFAGGSRATLSVAFAGPGGRFVGWLIRGLNERYLRLEAAGLKQRSEKDWVGRGA